LNPHPVCLCHGRSPASLEFLAATRCDIVTDLHLRIHGFANGPKKILGKKRTLIMDLPGYAGIDKPEAQAKAFSNPGMTFACASGL
jgi:hypothetical protein